MSVSSAEGPNAESRELVAKEKYGSGVQTSFEMATSNTATLAKKSSSSPLEIRGKMRTANRRALFVWPRPRTLRLHPIAVGGFLGFLGRASIGFLLEID